MLRILFLSLFWFGLCAESTAAELNVRVSNDAGVPLADAVVFVAGASSARSAAPGRARTTIVQRDRVFQPFVSVVQRGTAINFPNDDPFMHHVYSFSAAKQFEIKLYKGTPEVPIVFDKSGVVVLGCNVHDWMIAYVLVVDTPVYEKSGKDGMVRFRDLPAGRHQPMIWYPGMREPARLPELVLADGEAKAIEHQLKTTVKRQPPAPPFNPLRYSWLWPVKASPPGDVCATSRF